MLMPANDLYRRHTCPLPCASRTIQCVCGVVVEELADGTRLDDGKPHAHAPLAWPDVDADYGASQEHVEYADVIEPEPTPPLRPRWEL